ncbi:MAG: redoxin domain-containing protein [Alphaproteobacteria bacterium]|nr:redoxin domain-containing protein [Alphaproteobacteria bacterium]
MRRFALALLFACLALPAAAALAPGAKAPDFSAPASLAGKSVGFSLADSLKKGPVVVYFYPSAYTGGCNAEAHAFAEAADDFAAAGATIIGVSHDSIARLNDFSADPNYCAGKFPVASDPDGAIARSYDLKVMEGKPGLKDTRGQAIDHAFTERTTFVIAPDGTIAAVLSTADDKLAPDEHAAKALAIVRGLKTAP